MQVVEKELAAELGLFGKARLWNWRHRMNTNNEATTQWLLNQQSPLPPEIWVSQPTVNNPYGAKTSTYQESLHAIQTFWEQYWDRLETQNLDSLRLGHNLVVLPSPS